MVARQSVWEFTEAAPAWASPLVECWSWSLNCDDKGDPWGALLDLVGWSDDELGCRVFPWAARDWSLGWLELGYLSAALNLWSDRPYECAEWVRALQECDG